MASLETDLAAVARIGAVPTILRVIAESTGLGLTLVARVTRDQWHALAVEDRISFGLGVGDALDVATTLCSKVRDTHEAVVIEHADADRDYCDHPTPKMYAFQSYIAVPIFKRSGEYFGNVCALDPKPARLKEGNALPMMRLFADLISLQLEADDEQQLREQFIAVLGHDLRNPLSSFTMGAHLLEQESLPSSARTIVQRMMRSAKRMELLVENVLDLARGRLGGGIPLEKADVKDLDARLRHVVDELRSNHPARTITLDSRLKGVVRCDQNRVEQAISNLLGNAVEHGDRAEPIDVVIDERDDDLVVTVRNGGKLSQEMHQHLWKPFHRGEGGRSQRGLGLGLFIVAEIAKAHGGSVHAATTDGHIEFTFAIPLKSLR